MLNLRSFARFLINFAGKPWDVFTNLPTDWTCSYFAKLFRNTILTIKRNYRNPWKQHQNRYF